ncbi:MAG: dihydrolipoyl dehydrogenase family protein [Chloroflexota bacterium]
MAPKAARYDVVVVGGGPAGVTAALRARELGASTALVERTHMGGTCTNDGCVPTRVLAKAARLMRDAGQCRAYGLNLPALPEVDFTALIQRTQQIVYQMHEKKQLIDHLHDVKVDTFTEVGDARFIDPHTLGLPDGRTIEGEQFILCVGGAPRRLPFPGAEYALTHSDVWTMSGLPAAIAIVGGSATGCQLASIFNAFGSKVTVLDIAPQILPTEDGDVSTTVAEHFSAHGMTIEAGISGIDRIEKTADGLTLVYTKDEQTHTLPVDVVVMAVGWPGNVDALNLEAAGVRTERSYIVTDDHLRTTAPHIYAAGDITGRMMLVQSASYQARLAVDNALTTLQTMVGQRHTAHGGFTDPEYGGVGLTEADAQERDLPIITATIPYADLDRAVIDGHTSGFCKLIVHRETYRVLGAHVVGEQAVEVVQMIAAGMAGGLTIDRLADLEVAYPTFAAIVGLAARQIVRELGMIPVSKEWRTLKKVRGVEWERQEI